MRWIIIVAAFALAFVASGVVALSFWPLPESPELGEIAGDPKRGAYLLRVGGCIHATALKALVCWEVVRL